MQSISRRAYFWLTFCIISLFTLSACGGTPTGNGSTSNSQVIQVVAAENFYGNIIQQLGGSHVCGPARPGRPDRNR